MLIVYINEVFLVDVDHNDDGSRIYPEPDQYLLGIISLCLIYPLIYDGTQWVKAGAVEYLKDGWNYIDILNISLGYFNIYSQLYL